MPEQDEVEQAIEHEQTLAAAKYEKVADLAKALAATGFLEETCEEFQARLVAQWLESDRVEDRERCWHEVRAIEEIRHALTHCLAAPESEERAELVRSTWSWRRWRKIFQRGQGWKGD